jgi:diguanylate cyclase (GGDEF)-like protein
MDLNQHIALLLAALAAVFFCTVVFLYARKHRAYGRLLQQAHRRAEELELLTDIGQAVSSRLDPDEVLRTVHRELGRLFDTRNFFVAFIVEEDEEVRFELESVEGQVVEKRTRPMTNGITEHIVRSAQPLLIRSQMEAKRAELKMRPTGRPSKCFCGVPIFSNGRAIGVMAALHYEQEEVYEQRDLEVMQTAAGQVSVAFENARMFAEEQRRGRYLSFLNSVSKAAISSQSADEMLPGIVSEIQKNFQFDHIGLGMFDYATKEIEIKAEAGSTTQALGRRIPLGVGILGRVARSNELTLVQGEGEQRLLGLLPDARSVLCIPIHYAETLLGILNVESRQENAFGKNDVMILRTLADLLAAALHNAFVFQKMQQQSITDGLTGIKTRRFFLESVHAEWRRASRTGRSFSVVLIDLDNFKAINDNFGHLEGDLVLSRIGRILEQKSRQSNIVARYGGDEFVIFMPETSVEQAQILSERLRLWIATDPMLNERQLTASFGVATYPLHGSSVEDIIRVADSGMYVSKHAGGNKVSTPDDFGQEEHIVTHKQLVTTYIEGFLQRENNGPEAVQSLVTTLEQLAASLDPSKAVESLMEAVRMLTRAAETREVYAAGHGEAVAKHCSLIAHELGLSNDEVSRITFSARVHDVGKILISERILNKPGLLTEEEYHLVKLHPVLGEEIVQVISGSHSMAAMIRHHHERPDGGGYPDALTGEQIPLGSRIIAVSEAFVHMTAERPYATTRTPAQAIKELEDLAGSQFDGMVVRTFTRLLRGAMSASSGQA